MRLSRITRIATAAAAAALVLTATACGEQAELGGSGAPAPSVAEDATFEAGTTMAKLNEAGALRVGTKFDQPLFGLKGLDGNPVGFDVEIAKIIAAKLGIPADKITYTETPSKIREDVIANGQVDMVAATYTINDARKERISFAGPYYVAGQDIMVGQGQHHHHRSGHAQAHRRPGLLGDRLDPGQDDRAVRRPGQHRAVRRVLQVRRRPAQRPGRGGHAPTTSSCSAWSSPARARSSWSASPSPRSPTASASRRATSRSASSSTPR